jgi:hypothetical protein
MKPLSRGSSQVIGAQTFRAAEDYKLSTGHCTEIFSEANILINNKGPPKPEDLYDNL